MKKYIVVLALVLLSPICEAQDNGRKWLIGISTNFDNKTFDDSYPESPFNPGSVNYSKTVRFVNPY